MLDMFIIYFINYNEFLYCIIYSFITLFRSKYPIISIFSKDNFSLIANNHNIKPN